MQMLAGSVVLGVASIASGELASVRPERISGESLLAVGYLTLIGSIVAFTAFAWVLRQAPLPLIATYAFVNPIVAVFLGWLILHESVTPLQLVAGGVIVVGVALLIVSRSRMSSARPATRSASDEHAEDVVAA
jgi:drug/metabolite transporter (DMT)-like permease